MYVNILCSLEPCLGIITACLPILQPALARIFGGNPLEWTGRSLTTTPTAVPSAKTSTTLWSPKWPPKMNIAGELSLKWPSSDRTKSSATNPTWPRTNEKRIVRFKDVDWGDYFPQTVNTVPMSTFHVSRTRSSAEAAIPLDNLIEDDREVSPRSCRASRVWDSRAGELTSVSSQYWD